MTTQMDEIEDQMAFISQMYPAVYTQISTQQGEAKPRRRRRKNKGAGENSLTGAKKRKLSEEQVQLLELNFGDEHKLESERKDRIALDLGLDPRQVAVWFQNRRARWKNKKLEEEFTKLKLTHEAVVVEKCLLETEVLKLKEQLSKKDKEIQQLTERVDGVSSNSTTSSSLSMEAAMDPPFLGDFAVEGYEDAFYIGSDNNNYINHGMEWMNLYMFN